jgi:predicted flap endonuclease-1-like 5' DNA nuclease
MHSTEDSSDLPGGIGAPATRALNGAGYTSLGQLAGVSAKELSALHGFGPKAIRIIEEALGQRGQSLA